jgi:hypothetical protein
MVSMIRTMYGPEKIESITENVLEDIIKKQEKYYPREEIEKYLNEGIELSKQKGELNETN